MRQDEICRIRWNDVDPRTKTVLIGDRQDPREKDGNHEKVLLLNATGYDAWAIIQEQRAISGKMERVFPYSGKSAGTAFRRACAARKIEDLPFHDLRHEAASGLFEAGFTIEQVALVTLAPSWAPEEDCGRLVVRAVLIWVKAAPSASCQPNTR
jgi:integrase